MTWNQRSLPDRSPWSGMRDCFGGHPNPIMPELTDEARPDGLPPARPVHVDRSRQPATGDLDRVELVRHGPTRRPVPRFARDSGSVTLAAPGGGSAAVMRRQDERLDPGVVVDTARCATASPGG